MIDHPEKLAAHLARCFDGAVKAMAGMATVYLNADDLERIADRARAFEHARMCASLIWPWPGRESYNLHLPIGDER
jgi:hypothetical protein